MKVIRLAENFASGRTSMEYLLYASAQERAPILCNTYDQKDILVDLAEYLELSIPEPIVFDEGMEILNENT